MSDQVDVIIPHYGKESLLVSLLESLLEFEPSARPIVVNNMGCRLLYHDPAWSLMRKFSDWECIENRNNQGFVRGVNQGLALTTRKFVVVQNNDTLLYDNAYTRMLELFQGNDNLGAVGPVSGSSKGWQSYFNLAKVEGWEMLGDMAPQEAAEHLRTARHKHFRKVPGMLAFFCTMFRQKALAQTGTFSTEFGLGLGDDDDYCERLKQRGWQLGLAEGVLVGHLHRTSFRRLYSEEEIVALETKAMEIFQRRQVERQQGHGPGTWPMS